MTSAEQSATIRSSFSVFQIAKYIIYLLVMFNFLYYLWEDLNGYRYLAAGAPINKVFEAFAVTIDFAAWVVLMVLFELETGVIPEEKLRGSLQRVLNSVLAVCYMVLVYAFYGYIAGLVGYYSFKAFPSEEVCGLVDDNYAFVTLQDRYIQLTDENCGSLAQGDVYKSPDDKLVASSASLAAVIRLGWVDVLNAAVWLLVVLFMEWEVVLHLKNALSRRRLVLLKTIKGGLYLILLGNAIYWTVHGAFIDYWDAYLWLLAFVLIDLNIFQSDDSLAEGRVLPREA